jgi:D-alanyl-D-alanine carboxypeptidase
MSIGVVRGADTLVLQGFGFANLEDSVRATAGTLYRIGSITKQFTAAAILRLVEQGRIQLDSPLGDYLGAYIGPGRRATIRQVLTHTSGIPNYTELPTFAQVRQTDLSDFELLDLIRHRPLDFTPGTQWHYSNSNYYALGIVLQKLGGAPYGQYLTQTLLQPLGLTHTVYCSVEPIIPDRASGYSLTSDKVVNASYISMHLPGAAGALCSTVEDLLRWQSDLVGGRVVQATTYREMTTPAVLTNGTHTTYGFALGVYALHGHRAVEHSGGINGFSADLAYYPADSLSVVVLLNSDAGDAALVARRIAETVMQMPDNGALNLAVDSGESRRDVGTYTGLDGQPRIERDSTGLALVVGPASRLLQFQGAGRFVVADDHDTQLQFTVVGDGARRLTITGPDGQALEFTRAH